MILQQVTNSYFIGSWDDSRMLEIAGPGTYAEFQLQRLGPFLVLVQRLPPFDCWFGRVIRYSSMQVQFSTADWVISLGLLVDVPRMREKLGSTFETVTDVMVRLWMEECGPRKHSQACRGRCLGLGLCTCLSHK